MSTQRESASTPTKGKGEAPEASDSDDVMMEAPDSPPLDAGATSGGWQMTGSQPFRDSSSSQTMSPPANAGSRANGETKIHFGAPGSSWNTKKYNEEYERAEMALLDKQWKINQYGDPLAPSPN